MSQVLILDLNVQVQKVPFLGQLQKVKYPAEGDCPLFTMEVWKLGIHFLYPLGASHIKTASIYVNILLLNALKHNRRETIQGQRAHFFVKFNRCKYGSQAYFGKITSTSQWDGQSHGLWSRLRSSNGRAVINPTPVSSHSSELCMLSQEPNNTGLIEFSDDAWWSVIPSPAVRPF